MNPPDSSDIRELASAMNNLADSLNQFVAYLRENPQISAMPAAIIELNKRITILSTRL